MNNDDERGRRARNLSESLRWDRYQEQLTAAKVSSRANAEHFLAVLHQYKVRPYPVYFRPDAGSDYRLLATRGWMIDPARPPGKAGIVVTEVGKFYWYSHLRTASSQTPGARHTRFYEAAFNPAHPGVEVSPFRFADNNSLGVASGLPAMYLENLIKLLNE